MEAVTKVFKSEEFTKVLTVSEPAEYDQFIISTVLFTIYCTSI